MIIDFHTHTFPSAISEKVVNKLGRTAGILPHTKGSIEALSESMKQASVTWSVNLPVMTAASQTEKVNESLIRQKESLEKMGILTFGGIHPDNENVREILTSLAEHHIPGIKLHPAYQGVDLDDIRFKRILSCASELGLITVIHAGVDIGLYDHNYSSVSQILSVLQDVKPEKLVLAHMGNWGMWKEVETDLAGAPVWMDSAFTIGPLDPWPNRIETPWNHVVMDDTDFLRIARKHGMQRILFATDSPWQGQKEYIARFRSIGLTEDEQKAFFGQNALSLLRITTSKPEL